MTTTGPTVQQQRRKLLRRMDEYRERAAGVARNLFPKNLDRYSAAASKYGISRARNGSESNPLFRLVQWLAGLRLAGCRREKAELIRLWISQVIAELWSGEEVNVQKLMRREQEIDAAEDVTQMRVATGSKEDRLTYADRLEEQANISLALARAIRQEVRL